MGFSESVVVAETSNQMLEVLLFCDRERASPPSIRINCDNLSGEKSTLKISSRLPGVLLEYRKILSL